MTKDSFRTLLKLVCLQTAAQCALLFQGLSMPEAALTVGATFGALTFVSNDVRRLYRRALGPLPRMMGC